MADWGLIVTAAATGGLVIFNAVRESQAQRRKKHEAELVKRYGLQDNPSRCGEHKERLDMIDVKIGSLETRAAVLDTKVTALEKCADGIKEDVSAIRDRMN
jgi:hypothetical protein